MGVGTHSVGVHSVGAHNPLLGCPCGIAGGRLTTCQWPARLKRRRGSGSPCRPTPVRFSPNAVSGYRSPCGVNAEVNVVVCSFSSVVRTITVHPPTQRPPGYIVPGSTFIAVGPNPLCPGGSVRWVSDASGARIFIGGVAAGRLGAFIASPEGLLGKKTQVYRRSFVTDPGSLCQS